MNDIRRLPAGTILTHVSVAKYRSAPLHFGCAANRFDDPCGQYGVLYLAFDLATGLMESVFHGHQWAHRERTISTGEIGRRIVRLVGVTRALHVLDLTAPSVMAARLGLNLEQISSRDYTSTQAVSQLAHASPLDGIAYPSRNNFPCQCVALFDRCADALMVLDDIGLAEHCDWPAFCRTYAVLVAPDESPAPGAGLSRPRADGRTSGRT